MAQKKSGNWPFEDPPNVACVSCKQVFRLGKPILWVTHDDDDGGWQFLYGGPLTDEDAMVVGLKTVVKLDPSIVELADLPCGWTAERSAIGKPWKRRKRSA